VKDQRARSDFRQVAFAGDEPAMASAPLIGSVPVDVEADTPFEEHDRAGQRFAGPGTPSLSPTRTVTRISGKCSVQLCVIMASALVRR
jgi:hypothetical protein